MRPNRKCKTARHFLVTEPGVCRQSAQRFCGGKYFLFKDYKVYKEAIMSKVKAMNHGSRYCGMHLVYLMKSSRN